MRKKYLTLTDERMYNMYNIRNNANGINCGGIGMSKGLFVNAEEMSEALGISKQYAYKLMREMNAELKQKGFLTIPGRVSRRYFEEKFYGLSENR